MSKTFTTRFYAVGKKSQSGLPFKAALSSVFNKGNPGKRHYQLAQGYICRLENLDLSEPGYISGAMTRIKDTDFPAEITDTGAVELNVSGPIGNCIVFRFREKDHTLAIQYDPRVLSPGRFIAYIEGLQSKELFHLTPKLDKEALKKFRDNPLKKIRIQLASSTELGVVDSSMQAVTSSFSALKKEYEAPIITFEMGMGHNKGALSEGAKKMAEGFLTMIGTNDDADIRSLKAVSQGDDGSEPIDLIDQLLSDKQDIVLRSNNPKDIYEDCLSHIKMVLNNHV